VQVSDVQTSRRARTMSGVLIPGTRWHYLAYGGITAELAIQVQRSAKMQVNWAESSAWRLTAQGVTDRLVNGSSDRP